MIHSLLKKIGGLWSSIFNENEAGEKEDGCTTQHPQAKDERRTPARKRKPLRDISNTCEGVSKRPKMARTQPNPSKVVQVLNDEQENLDCSVDLVVKLLESQERKHDGDVQAEEDDTVDSDEEWELGSIPDTSHILDKTAVKEEVESLSGLSDDDDAVQTIDSRGVISPTHVPKAENNLPDALGNRPGNQDGADSVDNHETVERLGESHSAAAGDEPSEQVEKDVWMFLRGEAPPGSPISSIYTSEAEEVSSQISAMGQLVELESLHRPNALFPFEEALWYVATRAARVQLNPCTERLILNVRRDLVPSNDFLGNFSMDELGHACLVLRDRIEHVIESDGDVQVKCHICKTRKAAKECSAAACFRCCAKASSESLVPKSTECERHDVIRDSGSTPATRARHGGRKRKHDAQEERLTRPKRACRNN